MGRDDLGRRFSHDHFPGAQQRLLILVDERERIRFKQIQRNIREGVSGDQRSVIE